MHFKYIFFFKKTYDNIIKVYSGFKNKNIFINVVCLFSKKDIKVEKLKKTIHFKFKY